MAVGLAVRPVAIGGGHIALRALADRILNVLALSWRVPNEYLHAPTPTQMVKCTGLACVTWTHVHACVRTHHACSRGGVIVSADSARINVTTPQN